MNPLKLEAMHTVDILFQLLVATAHILEASVPEMHVWFILFIKSELKWCIHLSRNLFLYFLFSNHALVSYLYKACVYQLWF